MHFVQMFYIFNYYCLQMTTVVMAVMSWAVFIRVLLISSGVRMADASQVTGHVMVTMTVEISVMKPKLTAAGKVRFFFFLIYFPLFNTYKHRE